MIGHDPAANRWLDRIVVARTGAGSLHVVGRAISYTDEPTLLLVDRDGNKHTWVARLCEVLEIDAEVAEQLLPATGPRPPKEEHEHGPDLC